jgi:hypothetical protein
MPDAWLSRPHDLGMEDPRYGPNQQMRDHWSTSTIWADQLFNIRRFWTSSVSLDATPQ